MGGENEIAMKFGTSNSICWCMCMHNAQLRHTEFAPYYAHT